MIYNEKSGATSGGATSGDLATLDCHGLLHLMALCGVEDLQS